MSERGRKFVEDAVKFAGGNIGGRGDRDRPNGWDNPRDAQDEGVQHDDTRLTDEERYGVRFNTDPDTTGK